MRWTVLAIVATAAALALGVVTFVYAEGASYFTQNPQACANCHVMEPYLRAWQTSSHRHVAGCNDCHAPQGAVAKWVAKARNGLSHGWAFTTGDYGQNLVATAYNRRITNRACADCHASLLHHVMPGSEGEGEARTAYGHGSALQCTRCHSRVGHGG